MNDASERPTCPVDHKRKRGWLDQLGLLTSPPPWAAAPADKPLHARGATEEKHRLATEREVSTIPRPSSSQSAAAALNSEQQPRPQQPGRSVSQSHIGSQPADRPADQHTSQDGKWVYPSEKMFFDALLRKKYEGVRARDMRAIVPIHNAVNERAWTEILTWERGRGSERCGGPRLLSFSGSADNLTPRARFNTLLGYTAPFDRHDWVIDRCGTRIEYVIDFYTGRSGTGDNAHERAKPISFYLDVRPKLNTWEGCKMRVFKIFGA